MRIRHLLLSALFSCFISGSFLHAQNKVPSLSKEFSGDSLIGFDENIVRQDALEDGISGFQYLKFLEVKKRLFIYEKYNFHDYADRISGTYFNLNYAPIPFTAGKQLGGNSTVNAAPCVNEGFETGNITGWTCTQGYNTTLCAYPITTNTITFPNSSFVTTSVTPFVDPIFNVTITNSPFTGSVVVKLNDHLINAGEAVKLAQSFPVTSSNFLYEFAYIAMMATQHTCCQQPFMRVSVRDNVGNLLSCPLFTFAPPPPSGPICSSSGITWAPQSTVTTVQGTFLARNNPTWQKYSIDLTNYIGSNVSIEVVVADCQPTGHFGYAYFDSNCNQLGFDLTTPTGTAFIAAPSQTVNLTGLCAATATIGAPSGLGPYTWNGPSGSGITSNTNQVISVTMAGNYTISMNPPGSCVPINRVIALNFAPPTTVVATPTNICASGTTTAATLSAAGALNYTWNPGGLNSSTVTVSPISTTIYTLTAVSGTCVGTYTRQIVVNPTPTVVVSNPSGSVCAGSGATITATGAGIGGGYLWQPGAISGSAAAVSPTAPTVYTAIATSSSGCVGSETTIVGVSTAATPTIFNLTNPSSSVCAGTPVSLVGTGALNFTYNPTGATGNFVVQTPSITTTYTVTGAVGACTGTTAITVSVDPGPTMTVTGTPTIICPSFNASLTAQAPTSLGFTWTPPGTTFGGTVSTLVITPTTTTTYTVQGINAAGCRSTYTISQLVSPVPSITITASTSSICIGSSVSYTAAGGLTYTWNPGGITTANASFSPTTSTTYTVISSNGTCTSSATASVLVVNIPTVSALASPSVFCSGSSSTLTANGATNYTWMPGSLTGVNVVVSPTTSTIYTLTGNSAGCSSSTVVAITVNPNPTIGVVASPTALCPGFSSTLTPSGGSTYTLAGLFITGFSPFQVTPTVTTTYTMSGTDVLGCSSFTTISLLVNPTPTINLSASSPSICVGSSATLSALGGSTYTWSPIGLNGSNITVSPTITTLYTANGTSTAGCLGSNTINLIVVANPTVGATSSPTAICAGASATLTGNGGTTYTWTPGGLTGVNLTVTPSVTITYTVNGSTAGCSANSTVQVLVNPSPTITASASPTAICPGGSSSLTANGGVSYTWNPGALSGSLVSASPVSTTIYTVSGQSAFGCSANNTLQLIVNPTPTITATATQPTICAGSSATLTGFGGATYSWTPGGLLGTNVTVTPSITTTYTVLGTSAFGCSAQNTVIVTVNPNPTISASASPTAICAGGSATLTGFGGTTYTWTPGGVGTSITVSPTLTTTFSVTGSAGGCNGFSTVQVVVNPTPSFTVSALPTSICPGASTSLTATGAVNYTWNPGALSGSLVTVSPTITTIYTATGSSAFGCVTTRTVQVIVNPVPSVSVTATSFSICAGGSTTLTGLGASTYSWNPIGALGTTISVTPSVTATYTVIGTNTFGCSGQNTVTIIVIPIPTIGATASPTAICAGSSAILTGNGGTTYTWLPGGATGLTISVTPTVTSTYTVSGSVSGCSSNSTVQVIVNPIPSVTAVATPTAICPGGNSNLTATGATNYTWNPGSLSGSLVSVSPTTTTIYTVNAASAFGCSTTRTVQLVVNPAPSISVSPSSFTICNGGFVVLTASGASAYTWSPTGGTSSNITANPTVTTIYTVTGTSALGCPGIATATVVVAPIPTVVAVSNPTSVCPGGSSTLTATGATNYTWSTGATGSLVVVTPTSTTVYTVIGTSGVCTSTISSTTVVLNSLPTLTATASAFSICPGGTTTLTATGTSSSYTWQPGSLSGASVAVSPASATIYTVTGINASGCITTRTVGISIYSLPVVTVTASSPTTCSGGTDTLTASGAATYSWNPIGSTLNPLVITPTVTTTYTVIGTSSVGCIAQSTILVTVIPNQTITASASPSAICVGGSSTLSATGSTLFGWSAGPNFSSTVAVNNLSVTTTYSVFGIGSTCPSNTVAVTVLVNGGPSLVTSASPTAICPGNASSLTVSGGVNYTWTPGGSTATLVVVSPTSTTFYSVTGTSTFGCLSTQILSLVVLPSATIGASASPTIICSGQTAVLNGSGGASYTWTPGPLTGPAVLVNPTNSTIYTVSGTSSLGCLGQGTVSLIVVPTPTVSAGTNSTAICAGQTAVLTGSGATTYSWNPGGIIGSAVTVTPASTTQYTLTGTSGICSNTAIITITVNSLPTISVTSNPTAICPGGSATLTGLGASSYTWNPGSLSGSTVVVSPTTTTVYTVTGTNGSGCVSSSTISLQVNPTPTVSASLSSPTICAGQTSSLIANGATSYTWNPGALSGNSVAVTPTSNTTYTVIGNSLGCTSSATTQIIVNAIPVITATASPASICTGNSSTLTASGGTSYTWTPGALTGSNVVVSPTSNTPYIVTGANSFGCTNTQTVIVTVNSVPTLSIASTSATLCAGSTATLTASGTLSYSWSPGGSTSTVITVSPSSTTVYTLQGSNGFGCSTTLFYTLAVTPTPTLLVVATSPTICAGFTTAISANGASSYTWNPGGLTGSLQVVTPSVSTVYTVSGDNNGCVANSTIAIVVNPAPVITASANPSPVCIGLTSTLTANGAASYTWAPVLLSGASITVSPSSSTVYTVIGISALGCPNLATVSVVVLPTPTVSIAASSTAVCIGSSATLTANGAANYTWTPGSSTGSILVASPVSATTYTLVGDNGGCTHSSTISLAVNALPVVSAASSSSLVCQGSALTLSASGALNYTWNPSSLTGSLVTVNPTLTLTYTVNGEDANGCIGQAFTSVSVNALPVLTLSPSQSTICQGGTVTIVASGANSYTWSPSGSNSTSISASPTITSSYSASGTDANGCIGTNSIQITVVSLPSLTLSPVNFTVCAGSPATLTAIGATGYTWLPGNTTGSASVQSPTINTTYTVIADNGGNCPTTGTVFAFVNPIPANLVATCAGTIGCTSPSATLSGSSTDTNVSYAWTGPSSFSSTLQNPTVTIWGDFTLSVTNTITGCVATITVNVPTDNSIPSVTATPSGSITCAVSTVTLTAANTTTLVAYSWSGPSGFTSTATTPTVSVGGSYTVVVTDLSSTCSSTAVILVGTHTQVTITASISAATCSNGVSNNDGTIMVSGFGALDKFDLVSGASYTGTATYTNATLIPTSGIITSNLANPTNTLTYTIRIYDSEGCTKDYSLILVPVDCIPKVLGVAKAVSTPTTNTDGSYDVRYEVVVKNYDTAPLKNVSLTENLNNTFPLPTTFTVTGAPAIISVGSSLTLNSGFDGSTQTNLLSSAASTLAAGKSDTIRFVVRVKTQSNFGPFKNSIIGLALTSNSVNVSDSSNTGYNPNPDTDSNPTNNNAPTVITFTPHLFFGLTKLGSFINLTDNTYDVSYTVTVHNRGNDTLRNVVIKDSILGKVVKSPTSFSIKAVPVADGNLIANTNFNGGNDVDLVISGLSKMAPGDSSKIVFTINVNTYSATVTTELSNVAMGRALQTASGFTNNVADTSNSRANPDTNNNGIWNEPEDNVPTVIVLPAYNSVETPTLFIPDGFSPNDDGINDVFVIKGLPTNTDNSITIFNRWGNRVFYQSNYANVWDGRPNIAGTLGKDKLPEGTYYFILDMKGVGQKTGFIVLQY